MNDEKFIRNGFLSDNMQAAVAYIRVELKYWFAFAEDVNRLGMRWLHELVAPNVKTHQQLIVGTLLLRGIQTFQSAMILAERGIVADARSLARTICETAIAIGVAAADDGFVDRLVADHYRHRRKVANAMLNDPVICPTLTPEQKELLETALTKVKERYGESVPKPINWEAEAAKAGMTGLYLMIYRGTSGDSVHATALSLDRHVATNAEGDIQHLVFGPEIRGLDNTVSAAVTSILHALQVVPKLFPVSDTELAPLVTRYRKLVEPGIAD